jgi:hypothetical protein
MEEEEKQYPQAPPEIEKEVTGNVQVIKLMGNIVELYLTRIIDMFLSMMGGTNVQVETNEKQGDTEDVSDDFPDEQVAD